VNEGNCFAIIYLALKDVKNLKVKMVIRKKIVERSSSSTIYYNGESLESN
jgi:hypothetical protein